LLVEVLIKLAHPSLFVFVASTCDYCIISVIREQMLVLMLMWMHNN